MTNKPWYDLHHLFLFCPTIHNIESGYFHVNLPKYVDQPLNPLAQQGVYTKGNMDNISETISINISRNHDVVENVILVQISLLNKFVFVHNF